MEVSEILTTLGNPGLHYYIFASCLVVCSSTTAINHLLMTVWGYVPKHSCAQSVPVKTTRTFSTVSTLSGNATTAFSTVSTLSGNATTAFSTVSTLSGNATTAFSTVSTLLRKSCGSCLTDVLYTNSSSSRGAQVCSSADKCTQWSYELKEKETTVVSEWSLVCDDKDLKFTATTIYFVGVMFGGAFFGQLSDKIGRKPVVLICMYGHILLGVAVYFVPNYDGFVALRFFVGFLVQGLQTASYVLLIEMTSIRFRPIIGGVYEIFWAVGNLWMSVVAWLVQDWRNIQLALCLPSLVTLCYITILPESLRWLVSQGKIKDAEHHARRIAKFNKVELPAELNLFVSQSSKKMDGKEYSFHDLFLTLNMRKRTFLMGYIWLASSIGYYGLSMSISGLAGDRFANKLISAFVEVLAFVSAVLILKFMKRREPLMLYYLGGGVACIAAGIIKNNAAIAGAKVIATILAFFGKFCVAAAFATVFLFTVELFPTVVRSIAFGSCVFWARFGGMIAPQILKLGNYTTFKALPYLIIGIFSLLATGVTYFVPETHKKQLHDTIEQMEEEYCPQQDGNGEEVVALNNKDCENSKDESV